MNCCSQNLSKNMKASNHIRCKSLYNSLIDLCISWISINSLIILQYFQRLVRKGAWCWIFMTFHCTIAAYAFVMTQLFDAIIGWDADPLQGFSVAIYRSRSFDEPDIYQDRKTETKIARS